MSNNHLLKLDNTTTGSLTEHVKSVDTKITDDGNRYEVLMNSAPSATTQTTITCNLAPCFSAFNVAVVGTIGGEIADCIQLHSGQPHSSYTICNIVMEQPVASPSNNKIFVYNSDAIMDDVTANPPQAQHNIRSDKIISRSCSDQKAACVKVITDCKKSKNVDTSIPRLANSTVRDSKPHKQWQPPLNPLPLTSKPKDNVRNVSSALDQGKSINQSTANCMERQFKKYKDCDVTKISSSQDQSISQKQTSLDQGKSKKLSTTKQFKCEHKDHNMTKFCSSSDQGISQNQTSLDQGKAEKQTPTNYLERQFKCEHKGCGKSFAYHTHLRFHVQHAHTGYSPYVCNFEGCGRCFYTEHHLVLHLRAHTEVKPFVCPYEKCKKAFATTGNLRNHVRTHTGEKPYKCSYQGCTKAFAELSSVKKHELTHTGEKPHPCRICGRCFSQAGSRNTHERLKHKDVFMSSNVKT